MKRFFRSFVIGLSLVGATVISVLSQTSAQKLSFEVASVKRNTTRPTGPVDTTLGCRGTDSRSPGMILPVGRCISRNQPLRLVIALAYDIPPSSMYPYQGKVLSGPDWINNEVYDIEAKAESPATYNELKLMLQDLLVDRFKLKVHREPREMPIYALVQGKGTLKLQEAPKDRECDGQRRNDHRFELGATSLAGQCHGFVPDQGALTGRSVDMSDFAEMLSIWAERLVIDKTGLQGLYDIRLPRLGPTSPVQISVEKNAEGGRGIPGGGEVRLALESLPTVFTALEQLGLKLESTKGPVDVLVIDNIERPSEN